MYLKARHYSIAWLNGWIVCLLLLLAPLSQAQESYGQSDAPVAAEALDVQIRTGNPDEMAFIIRQVLLVNYVKEHHLEATGVEVDQFLARKKEVDARMRKKAEARREQDEKALQSKTLTDTERTQLESELKFIDEMLKANSVADDPQRAVAENQMAKAVIEQWKVSQALYRQFGGRVIYQQVGAKPLDAYHEFFKAAQKSGDFTILNEDFEPAFWSYYTTDKMHKFYPEKEAEQAINTRWWLMDPPGGQ